MTLWHEKLAQIFFFFFLTSSLPRRLYALSWSQDKTEHFLNKTLFVVKKLMEFGITQNYILGVDRK